MKELQKIVRYLDISEANMEDGNLRVDVNISISDIKVEIKNINSFYNIGKAIDYEIIRQSELLNNNEKIVKETRLFNQNDNKTYSLRLKEDLSDYKYMTEPDLLPIEINDDWILNIQSSLPKLPNELLYIYLNYGLTEYDANLIIEDKWISKYFNYCCELSTNYKELSNWINIHIRNYLNENKLHMTDFPISPKILVYLINLIKENKL